MLDASVPPEPFFLDLRIRRNAEAARSAWHNLEFAMT